ncbi:PREDICTED: cation transport regulator-like protein 1 [Charadrius vociferus]|uniref:cation transport regulator-like protein 1 n=1 Tax=Charadrius vociferus TaxID=50402 RepID=UPI0005211EA4|nr:PREDICTED: cation transport regulator-like protein 1 [Charadrius vociferus]
MVIQGDKSESQSRRAGEKGMLYAARHGRTDARAVQAVDVSHGECAKPGRVVTLLEDCGACTWGVAYEVRGEQIAASLQYLNMREAVLGGYDTKLVKFHPQEKDAEEPILALVYIATPQNPSYLGPASEEDIAAQIIVSSGCAGHNIEYLLRLADFMRYFCPQAEDKHLFSIEEALISILPCLYYTEESLEETASVPQKSELK